MRDVQRPHKGSPSPGVGDFRWGQVEAPFKLGIWAARTTVEPGGRVELRAAVHNVSEHSLGLGRGFRLAVKHGEEVIEHFGGPRPSEPILLEPGEFRELFGWSLDEESGLKVGVNQCRVIYRPEGGAEIRSAVIEIEVSPPAK